MKQHITIEQLNELSEQGKKKLTTWLQAKFYYNYYATCYGGLLSIGQMIEFLDWRLVGFWRGEAYGGWEVDLWIKEQGGDTDSFYEDKFCDALWSACKEVLNENNN